MAVEVEDRLSPKPLNRHLLLTSLPIIWLGFALRLHNLAGDSFWIDEIITARIVEGGVKAILGVRDHPPLLYALTSISADLFGDGEFGVRMPAFLAGVLLLPLLMLLGRLMGRPAAGLWAALLLALMPFHVGLSQTARHYALLTTFSLATYVVLYLAQRRPRWSTWIVYALLTLLNLYTHYGSFIVLIFQVCLIAAWLISMFLRGDRRPGNLLFPVVAGVTVILLYIPWLSQFQIALNANTGEGVVTDTGTLTPLFLRVRNAFWTFNLAGTVLPYIVLVLALIGLILLAWQRNWYELALLTTATVVSLAMITIFQVARGPFPRYISFVLPFYVLTASIALAAILQATAGKVSGTSGHRIVSVGLVLALVVAAWPGLQREYDFVLEDWKNILTYLDQEAHEGDVLVALSLNHRKGFNLVDASLPYYLSDLEREYVYLSGNSLQQDDLTALKETEKDVWAVVFDWDVPAPLKESKLDIVPFQTALYVVRDGEQAGTTLERVKALYSQLIPFADELPQRCLMRLDNAVLSAAGGDWMAIVDELTFIETSCPELFNDSRIEILNQAILSGKLSDPILMVQLNEALSMAAKLLKFDRKDELALEVLTAVNLGEILNNGAVVIKDEDVPEPVRFNRFTMPHNGDWGLALLIHPPASVIYTLKLPEEPVAFHTRLALAPESWPWGGDGATFVLRIQKVGEESVELFRRHIGNSVTDHDWHEVEVSLADYAGQEVTLTLATETGPVGDGTGDWAGWETPRLIWIIPDNAE